MITWKVHSLHANNLAMMVTSSILQLVLFVCIGTKFFQDIATIITNQYDIYLCSYVAADLIPDPHNITGEACGKRQLD